MEDCRNDSETNSLLDHTVSRYSIAPKIAATSDSSQRVPAQTTRCRTVGRPLVAGNVWCSVGRRASSITQLRTGWDADCGEPEPEYSVSDARRRCSGCRVAA